MAMPVLTYHTLESYWLMRLVYENCICEFCKNASWYFEKKREWFLTDAYFNTDSYIKIEAELRIYASVNYTTVGSDNCLSPERRQAIILTNAGILLIGPLGTNFSETFIEIKIFSLTNLHFKVSSAKVTTILSRPQCVDKISYYICYCTQIMDSRNISRSCKSC